MSLYIRINIAGQRRLEAMLGRKLPGEIAKARFAFHRRLGLILQRDAVRLAPRSPTRAQHERTLKGRLSKRTKQVAIKDASGRTIRIVKQRVRVKVKAYSQVAIKNRSGRTIGIVRQLRRRQFHPGQLENSIRFDNTDRVTRLFVPSNSPAGKYAYRMEHEFGITWWQPGVGTIAKGGGAGAKYMSRAIAKNEKNAATIYRSELQKALARCQR